MSKRQCCGYNTYKRLVCNLWMELPCAFLYLFGVISVSRGGGKLGKKVTLQMEVAFIGFPRCDFSTRLRIMTFRAGLATLASTQALGC